MLFSSFNDIPVHLCVDVSTIYESNPTVNYTDHDFLLSFSLEILSVDWKAMPKEEDLRA